ncbi:MAG: fatty acid desaturase [Elusimicrobia bacterium]|nr:fatty acid desaturase [Elusimicrobiota bacterium]
MNDLKTLNALLAKYKEPELHRSLWQLANTAVPFAVLTVLMHASDHFGHGWVAFALALPAAALLMRLFIIQHDCGHGAFFKSGRANDWLGAVLGVLTLTPYSYWKETHAMHHATSGNLSRRGFGDIETLTVSEYAALSRWGRLKYRLYRSVPVLFFIGPSVHFVVNHRIPVIIPPEWKQERLSILLNDLVLASILATASYTVGLWPFLKVQLPVCMLAATAGVWFFYVQHQFEGTYWAREEEWDFVKGALEGSSYYQLPAVLQWVTGNIGFHHIHHLNSRIPNYNLPRAMKENPEFHKVKTLTLWTSLKCIRLALWDEEKRRLVGFDAVRPALSPARAVAA